MAKSGFYGKDWFEHYFGFIESAQTVQKNILVEDYEDHSEIISQINGKRINCGKFSLRSMNSYKNILDLLQSGNNQEGHFHIIHGYGRQSTKIDLVDIVRHQNHEYFNGATFVAASNFNLLEYGSSNATAKNGISQYAVDSTQGPAFATATIGATVYRTYFAKHEKINTKNSIKNHNSNSNYFIDYEDSNEHEIVIGQLEYEINLLERTPIPVIHGKAYLNKSVSKVMKSEYFNNFDFTDENNYEIAIIQNAEVTTNLQPDGNYVDSKPNQFVHQIFASSFDLSDYVDYNESNLKIMQHILFNEYRMSILQAIENSIKYPNAKGSNKLVLPMIGAGFFRNPIEIVTDSIRQNEDLIIASGIDVYLVCFSDSMFQQVYPLLKDTVENTKGSIIDTK